MPHGLGAIQHDGNGNDEADPVHQEDGLVEQLEVVGGHALVAQVAGEREHHDLHHRKPGQPQPGEHVPPQMAIRIG